MGTQGWIRVALVIASVAAPRIAPAQETVHFASVSGRVLDTQGGALPGAQVVARQTETDVKTETTTDQEGRFRFPYLRVGSYDITATLTGFSAVSRTLTLAVGAAFELPFTMSVAGVTDQITVSAQAALIETARSQIAGTISQTEVSSVPLNGRNFLDLALLVPGVSPTNTNSTQLFAETSGVVGQGLSVNSQRNFSNSFLVDGLSANDDAAGLSGLPYTVDAVDQFQVVTSGGQAELGRALGGYVSVVTKSGTNTTRGDVYGYFRDDALNGENALTGTTLPMLQRQYGASAGGPIARGRTFYFANVERKNLEQTGVTTITEPTRLAVNARLDAVGYPGAPVATGQYDNPVRATNALGKLDHQLSAGDSLTVRYSYYSVDSSNARGAGGLNAPSGSSGLNDDDHAIAVGNTLTLSPRTVNETRAQVTHSALAALPTDTVGPTVTIAGAATFGTFSSSPQRRTNAMVEVVDNLSHQRGAHALRAGVDFLYNDNTIVFPRSARGAYTFSSLANFLSGTYNNAGFTQTFGETSVAQTNPNLGVYAQDEWKARNDLTINAGVRYDLQWLETIELDTNNVSPRLGLAWAPRGSSATLVRANAGLFYDRVPLRALANALLSAGNTTDLSQLRQLNVSLSPTQAGAPVFPAVLPAAVATVTLPNLTTMDRELQNAHARQASVEVERQLGGKATYTVGYQYVRGVGLLMSVNQNVPSCVASGANNGCRPIADYANNSQYRAAGSSRYHGLHVSLVNRPSAWGAVRVSYTLSTSKNNVGEFFFSSPIDPFDIDKDWGRSDDDQRQRLVINGNVNTPMTPADTFWQRLTHGFQFGGTLQNYSALPFNITSGVTTVQGTAGRPLVNGAFIERNAGEGSPYLSVNARASRSFRVASWRLEGVLEVFNLTNRRNDLTRNGNFGAGAYPSSPTPTFNQITAVADPRTIQVALRARF